MASTKQKGDILEQVVAWLQEEPHIRVQRQVRLPTIGSTHRRREFDILLTITASGREIRLAVECKNEAGKIGAPKIDAFRGKLEAAGIPSSLGIYVAAHGYTAGALEAARAAGIQTLLFEGLSADRLSLAVREAFQSVVVLVPEVTQLNVVNGTSEPIHEVSDMFLFYDETGEPAGTVADFVWEAWQAGDVQPTIGTAYLTIDLPAGWHNRVDGQPRDIEAYGVTIQIIGLALTLTGEASRAALVGTADGDVVRHGITANFSPPQGTYDLRVFTTEQALTNFLQSRGLVHLVFRVKSPRIRFWNMMFWPPSQRVADTIQARMEAFERGEIPDPRPFSFEELEGHDLGAAWEQIADEYRETWAEREETLRGASA